MTGKNIYILCNMLLSRSLKVRIYNSAVRLIVTYGSETWLLRQTKLKAIRQRNVIKPENFWDYERFKGKNPPKRNIPRNK